MGKEKDIGKAEELIRYSLAFQYYAQYLRYLHNKNKTLLTGRETIHWDNKYSKTAIALKREFEKKYHSLVQEFTKEIAEKKTQLIQPVVNALGVKAFDQAWFIDGLKNLIRKGKEFKISKENFKVAFLGKKIFYGKLFDEIYKLEKRMRKQGGSQNSALSFYDEKKASGVKTFYYRDFHKHARTFYFEVLYHLLYPEIDNNYNYLKGIPPIPIRDIEKAQKKIEKYFL